MFTSISWCSRVGMTRVILYVTKLWDQEQKQSGKLPLPTVIPLKFYHGRRRWTVAFDPRPADSLPRILRLLDTVARTSSGLRALEAVMRYFSASECVEEKDLHEALTSVFPDEGENLMVSVAEKYIREGIQEGKRQGSTEMGQGRGTASSLTGKSSCAGDFCVVPVSPPVVTWTEATV